MRGLARNLIKSCRRANAERGSGAAALTMFAAKLYFRLINLKLIFIAGRKLFCCCLLRDARAARGISIIFALNYANISISFAFMQPHKIIKWK
jgi:hypothetical protein